MSESMVVTDSVQKQEVRSADIVLRTIADKPYYEIKYQTTDGEWHIGYGSYNLNNLVDWLHRCFEIVSYEKEIRDKAIEELKELVEGHKYVNAEDGTTIEEMLKNEETEKKYAWYLSRNQCCDWMLHRLDEIAEQMKEVGE